MAGRAFEAFVVPLADATTAHGNKAAALARLIRAGQQNLHVPPGIAIAAAAHTAWLEYPHAAASVLTEITHIVEERLVATIGAHAADMRWVVRSSSQAEDDSTRTAAGIFASVRDVGFAELANAIATVWRSAHSDVAAAYGVDNAPMGVIVQHLRGGAAATAYLRQDAPAILQWMEQGAPTAQVWQEADAPPHAARALQVAKIAQHVLAPLPNADIELVYADGLAYIVQARPLQPRRIVAANPPDAELFAFSRAQPEVIWRLDLEHNPAPLSTAQAELVTHVAAQPWVTAAMRVVGGYLYYAETHRPVAALAATAAALRQAMMPIAADMQTLLTPWANPTSSALRLDRALAIYTTFYQAWYQRVSPLLGAARATVVAGAATTVASSQASDWRVNAPAAILRQVASGEKTLEQAATLLQNVATSWDVASPMLGEDPSYISAWVARYRLAHPTLLGQATTPSANVSDRDTLASELAYWEEADDYWFYDAQAIMRRALLAMGKARGIGDMAMWIPWTELSNDAVSTKQLAATAHHHQAAHAVATRVSMPLRFAAGAPLIATDATRAPGARTTTYTGLCVGGVALPPSGLLGVVVNLAARGGMALGDVSDRIVICANITPATALALAGARAIISATGGPLDHGAAIARELGIPAVVGCTHCTEIATGVIVHLAVTGSGAVAVTLRS